MFALAVSVVSVASLLQWQDCALQADIPSLHLTAYAHYPDPEILSENHTISKTYFYNGNDKLESLLETVYIEKSPVHPNDPAFVSWVPFFNNSFDLCEHNDNLCPVNSNTSFSLSDSHPPSTTSTTGSWYRAKEYYYSKSTWIGCLSTVYQVIE